MSGPLDLSGKYGLMELAFTSERLGIHMTGSERLVYVYLTHRLWCKPSTGTNSQGWVMPGCIATAHIARACGINWKTAEEAIMGLCRSELIVASRRDTARGWRRTGIRITAYEPPASDAE